MTANLQPGSCNSQAHSTPSSIAEKAAIRLAKFQKDLVSLDPVETVRRHITFGISAVLEHEKYFELKTVVASEFTIHPSEVVMVGSAKLGFSIAPQKTYQVFGEKSDIDLAIISPTFFDLMWKETFEHHRSGGYWPKQKDFAGYLFQGWIRPDLLSPTMRSSKRWWDFFRKLTNSEQFGPYKISAALYREWFFLEQYQAMCIDKCKRSLSENNGHKSKN